VLNRAFFIKAAFTFLFSVAYYCMGSVAFEGSALGQSQQQPSVVIHRLQHPSASKLAPNASIVEPGTKLDPSIRNEIVIRHSEQCKNKALMRHLEQRRSELLRQEHRAIVRNQR